MMHMEDAVRATLEITNAPIDKIKLRSSYNIAGTSFSPDELATEIRKHIPEFTLEYAIDSRQNIADSWPDSIDDSAARQDWGWNEKYSLEKLVSNMLENIESASTSTG
jgi:nucleoside-diphosphate-sugar epimerase